MYADPVIEAIAAGEAWLRSVQTDDGAWNKRLDVPATAFAIQGLRSRLEIVTEDEAALAAAPVEGAADLALQLLGTLDPSLSTDLQALRNPDGSYGAAGEDLIVTTGLAVLAQAMVGVTDVAAATYLAQQQNPDGSWGRGGTGEDTGRSAYALQRAGVAAAVVQKAIGWLTLHQSPEGEWGSSEGAAWALLALHGADGQAEAEGRAGEYLITLQNDDGGFGRYPGGASDAAATGLVLWALTSAGTPFDGGEAAVEYLGLERAAVAGWFRERAAVFDTTIALDTLDILARNDAATAIAVLWVVQRETPNTDFLSRRFGSLSRFNQDVEIELGQILDHQLSDGGWGTAEEFGSTVLDTAVVLEALDASGFFDTFILNRGTGFLTASQDAGGSWGLFPGDDPEVWSTALAVQTLKRFRRVFDLEPQIESGRAWLETQQRPDGGWGKLETTVWETALTFSALMSTAFTPAVASQGIDYLLAAQRPDGSWNGDPLDTALAMRALIDSKPNLRARDQDISFTGGDGGVEGDSITVSALVQNGGGFPVQNVVVRFFLEDPHAGGTQIGTDQLVSQLGPGEFAGVSVPWDTTGLGGDKNVFVLADPDDLIDEGNEFDNKAVNRFRVSSKPDLLIDTPDLSFLPEFPLIGETITFTVLVHNIGETDAPGVAVAFEVGTAGEPGHSATTLGPVDVPAGGTVPLTYDTSLPEGEFALGAAADPGGAVDESNEANNSAVSSISMAPRMDLVVQAVYMSLRDPFEGAVLEIWADAYNSFADPATDVDVAFFMDGLPGEGLEIGRVNLPTLGGGQVLTTDRISWNTLGNPGDHTVYAVIDPENLIAETDENNNLQVGRFQVNSLPDLVMGQGTIAFHPQSTANPPVDTVPLGTPVAMRAALSNDGASDAHDVLVRFYLGHPLQGGVQIGNDVVAEIVRFKSGPASGTTAAVFPWLTTYVVVNLDTGALPKGDHFVYGWMDPENTVLEPNVDNNLGFSVLRVGDEADLTFTSFTVDDPFPEERDEAVFHGVVKNLTETPVVRFTIRLYDGNPATGAPMIVEFEAEPRNGGVVPGILGGESLGFTITWDTDLQVGPHDLYLVADPDGLVPELDEDNNVATLSMEVVPASTPDFEVLRDEVTFAPPEVAVGEPVDISAVVHNRRRFQATNVPVRFLRVDPALGEVTIGSDQVIPSLGDLASETVQVTLDTSQVAGSTPILVKVDPDNVIDERDETNNTAATILSLRLSDASRPTNVQTQVDLTDVYVTWDDPADPAVIGYDVLRDAEVAQKDWEDWARRSTVTASSTASTNAGNGFPAVTHSAQSAIDGDYATYWRSDGSNEDTWLALQLPKPVWVAAVTLVWLSEARDFEIQTWDGFEWQTAVTVRGNEDTTTYHELPAPVRSDRVRIVRFQNQGASSISLFEARVQALRLVE